ncbi:MAG: lipoate--protein ligase family protein [Candidatus Margulisbacteria bacterium]|nr:lipoate--protein ligase family protein [Candidatus Margulisiibacteriota bacterium]
MQKDEDLFLKAEHKDLQPTLRIYQWQPQCISLGYSQKSEKLLNLEECKNQGWDIVQRLTGGGIVFHNIDEITYSLFLPKDHPKLPKGIIPCCNFISEILVKTLKDIGIKQASIAAKQNLGSNKGSAVCFSRPTKYEIMVDNQKIIGSAQKQGKRTLLQHGSICIRKNLYKTANCLLTPLLDKSIGIANILNGNFNKDLLIKALISNFNNNI